MATKKKKEEVKEVKKKKTTKTTVKKEISKKAEIEELKEVNVAPEKESKTEVLERELKEKNSTKNLITLIAVIVAAIIVLIFFPETTVWNIIVLLLMLSALIFVHELGHFIMAKLFGVHVYEFAIGMGPMVFSFRRKNDPTLYSIRALPIGGFNSIAGESYDDDDKLPKEAKMCYKPKWQRFLILVAGVTMNFITAIIILFCIGLTGATEQDSVIAKVEPDTPAEKAGLQAGDKIVKLNGYKIDSWSYLSIVSLLKNDSNVYTYEIEHPDGRIETYEITPMDAIQVNDKDGTLYFIDEENTEEKIVKEHNLKQSEYAKTKIIGIVGVSEEKHGLKNAIHYAFKRFAVIVKSMLLILGSLITGKLSLDALSGPVGMYSVVKQSAQFGFVNLIYLTGYLSINLGVMNILPFPAFDGGHILFILIELITGKRVNEKFENICHLIGFVLIFALMIFITFKDILKLIG